MAKFSGSQFELGISALILITFMAKRAKIHWSNSSMEPVPSDMADAAMLLELNREWTELLSELVDRSYTELLHECLTILQRHLGVQAVGLYDFDDEWKLIEGVGGRSLVPLVEDYFEDVLERNQTLYLADEPALGWGQFLLPFTSEEDRLDSVVLRLVGRKLDLEELPTVEAVRDLFSGFLQLLIRNQQKHKQLLNRLQWEMFTKDWKKASGISQLLNLLTVQLQEFMKSSQLQVELSTLIDPSDQRKVLWRSAPVSEQSSLHIEIRCTASMDGNLKEIDWNELSEFLNTHFLPRVNELRQSDLRHAALQWKQSQSPLIGNSDPISLIRKEAHQLIQGRFPLLISGSRGVGKREAALYLARMRVGSQDLIAEFNAGTLQQNWTVFSEIFNSRIVGQTILLRNIDCLPQNLQEQILKTMRRSDEESQSQFPCWIISTSTTDLHQAVQAGEFHKELYRRISLSALQIPALHQRPGDILPLAEHFLKEVFKGIGKKIPEFSADARELMQLYRWPGNVTELKSVIQRLTWQRVGSVVASADLFVDLQVPQKLNSETEDATLADATLDFQRAYIRAAISKADGNMTEAAKLLGLHRTNFYRKMHQLKIIEADETSHDD